MINRYAELLPEELERIWEAQPIALCPWGALEWHGPHLPLGLDGLVAERFAERLADRAGGVLLPTVWLPITALPHKFSLSLHSEVVIGIWRDLVGELYRAGARVICLITGHYAQGHEIELYNVALEAMAAHSDLCVLAATPLELLHKDEYLDHAGRWETAQLLNVRPELVHLDKFPGMQGAKHVAVLGEDPRHAKSEEAEALTASALDVWTEWIERWRRERNQEPLVHFYRQRMADYESYVRHFYAGSWEDAIRKWWSSV